MIDRITKEQVHQATNKTKAYIFFHEGEDKQQTHKCEDMNPQSKALSHIVAYKHHNCACKPVSIGNFVKLVSKTMKKTKHTPTGCNIIHKIMNISELMHDLHVPTNHVITYY